MLPDLFIAESETLKEALKRLDRSAKKVLIVADPQRHLLGTLTDGDIRRALLQGSSFESPIAAFYNKNPVALNAQQLRPSTVHTLLLRKNVELVPIIDDQRRVIDYITWKEAFGGAREPRRAEKQLGIPVVIMAGGKGERLDPFTTVLPKPLIPIGDKTIIERIIEVFALQGASSCLLTLNYKGDLLEAYLRGTQQTCPLSYHYESDFKGTAGCLKELEEKLTSTFIVSNCDVLLQADFSAVLEFHRHNGAALTLLSAIQYYRIPYGIVRFKQGGELSHIEEKPEYTFTINAGVYVLEPRALSFIPANSRFDMTDLITALLKAGEKVFTFPINENEFVDIGQWDEYRRAIEKLRAL